MFLCAFFFIFRKPILLNPLPSAYYCLQPHTDLVNSWIRACKTPRFRVMSSTCQLCFLQASSNSLDTLLSSFCPLRYISLGTTYYMTILSTCSMANVCYVTQTSAAITTVCPLSSYHLCRGHVAMWPGPWPTRASMFAVAPQGPSAPAVTTSPPHQNSTFTEVAAKRV